MKYPLLFFIIEILSIFWLSFIIFNNIAILDGLGVNTWCHSISVTFKFWCWVPRESVLRGSSALKATRTAQNLKVTLIEWLLKLTLLEWHQVFRPMIYVHKLQKHVISTILHQIYINRCISNSVVSCKCCRCCTTFTVQAPL